MLHLAMDVRLSRSKRGSDSDVKCLCARCLKCMKGSYMAEIIKSSGISVWKSCLLCLLVAMTFVVFCIVLLVGLSFG
jgi:hypothetical protein